MVVWWCEGDDDCVLVNGIQRCIFCMSELDENSRCTLCRKQAKDYKPAGRCLLPGTHLAERYVLGAALGEGSFGITYLAWDFCADMPVAIKEFYPVDYVRRDVVRGTKPDVELCSLECKEEYQNRLMKFQEEARCLSRFQKLEGIVSVWDVFDENNTSYIVMEYIKGQSVKEYVKENGALSEKMVLFMMKPVMEALAQIHPTGLIHRDISPDNIMVDSLGRAVLIDFGAARMTQIDKTKSMTLLFKHGFSPEEQCRPKGKISASTDIYALCATMYYMLSAKVPVDAVDRMAGEQLEKLKQINTIKISDRLADAIEKGMAIKASDRFQSDEEMIYAIFDTAGDKQGNKETYSSPYKKIIGWGLAMCVLVLAVTFAGLQSKKKTEKTSTDIPMVSPTAYDNKVQENKQTAVTEPGRISEQPKVTKQPKETVKPKVTKKVKETTKPKVIKKSKKTVKPKVTAKAKKTAKPKTTQKSKKQYVGSVEQSGKDTTFVGSVD